MSRIDFGDSLTWDYFTHFTTEIIMLWCADTCRSAVRCEVSVHSAESISSRLRTTRDDIYAGESHSGQHSLCVPFPGCSWTDVRWCCLCSLHSFPTVEHCKRLRRL